MSQDDKLTLEDRALKYIESHTKEIWWAIALFALLVVLIKRHS